MLQGTRTQQSTKDLNLLADLIGAGTSAPTEVRDLSPPSLALDEPRRGCCCADAISRAFAQAFKLNLFPEMSIDAVGNKGAGGGASSTIQIDVGR